MSTPQRIQLKRTKGWRLPPNTVVVSRPSKWGNPFKVGPFCKTTHQAVEGFRLFLDGRIAGVLGGTAMKRDAIHELRGKNLACWCKPGQPCHADVLLENA